MNASKRIGPRTQIWLLEDRPVGGAIVEPFAVQIQHGDQVGHVLRNLPEQLRAAMEMLLGDLSLDLLLFLSQSPADGRPQPLEPILDHVISRPFLETINGRLFAQCAGNKNERDLRAGAARQLQRRHSIE